MTQFQKGRAKTGGRKPGGLRFKSIRERLTERKVNVADEAVELLRKTRDEQLKFEIIKFLAEYSQAKPTTNPDEESADVTDISAATLLKLAAGDTTFAAESEPDTAGSDQDALREGDSDAADALDSAENERKP
jgi:hypothetical protein